MWTAFVHPFIFEKAYRSVHRSTQLERPFILPFIWHEQKVLKSRKTAFYYVLQRFLQCFEILKANFKCFEMKSQKSPKNCEFFLAWQPKKGLKLNEYVNGRSSCRSSKFWTAFSSSVHFSKGLSFSSSFNKIERRSWTSFKWTSFTNTLIIAKREFRFQFIPP